MKLRIKISTVFIIFRFSGGEELQTLDFFIGNARIDGKFLVFETHEFITDKRGNANEKEVTKQANLMKDWHRLFHNYHFGY